MKLHAGERPTIICWVFLTLAIIFVVPAGYFFKSEVKHTDKHPAASKHSNRECLALDFWDHHDIWHFLSSFGLFFMLMFLLTIDDDIALKRQSDIQVW
jgi:hypothetical protein